MRIGDPKQMILFVTFTERKPAGQGAGAFILERIGAIEVI
jgi:hypothetical protein